MYFTTQNKTSTLSQIPQNAMTQILSTKPPIPYKEGKPDGHGRFNLKGNGEGYIGNVVKGSISHKETLGCLSPAVDSSQPTYTHRQKLKTKLYIISFICKHILQYFNNSAKFYHDNAIQLLYESNSHNKPSQNASVNLASGLDLNH